METFVTALLLGIVSGSVYAIAATGIVLTYKTSGILNLGYGALAIFFAYIHWQFTSEWGWPAWVSALVVLLLIAPMVGAFLDTALFRRIEGQPAIIGVIATVGLFVLLRGVVELIWGGGSQSVQSLFPTGSIHVFGDVYISKDSLGVFIVAGVAAGLLAAMLRFTKLGVAFRAVVNNRPVAGLMAINTGFVSGLAWAMSTAFAALVGILLTPRTLIDPNLLPPLVIAFVLGASVVGYLRSLPLAYLGGLILGVGQSLIIQYSSGQESLAKLQDGLPFLMITVAVLIAPKAIRLGQAGASFVVKTRELTLSASPRARLWVAAAVFGILALVPPLDAGSIGWKLALIQGLTRAIVFLSLVVLTGYSGQISLGQTAFMGIAVFSTAHAVVDLGLPMWASIPVGMLVAAAAGALIGFVAARLHGLFLALMTLAFAFMAQSLLFSNTSISGGEGGIGVPRPEGFAGVVPFYYLVLAAVIGCSLLAVSLRTGRTGRILGGMRDSETACRSLGIPVTRYKVLIFALSATIAGLGGILNAMILQQAHVRSFLPFDALFFLTLAVVGGIFHVGGAIVSGLFFAIFGQLTGPFPWLSRFQLIFFGLGATLALANNPEGMFGELRRAGNAILGAAQRRRARPEPLPVAGGSE